MRTLARPVPEIRIISRDASFSMSLAVALRGSPCHVTVIDAGDASLDEVARRGSSVVMPVAAVVELTGAETALEMRALLQCWPETRCLFIVRAMPLRATLARIVGQHAGVILSKDERPIVIMAMLITMMMDLDIREA